MTRLRYNGLLATLGGSLSVGATTITLADHLVHSGGTDVPTIAGSDYIPLALVDPDSGQLTEIVHLTAYAAGATTGTISRAQESTSAVGHASGELVTNAPMVADFLDPATLQPVDSDLTAIAALATTSYGRAFLALADAAAGRTALGLGTAATQASGAFDAAGAATAAQAASQPVDSDLTAIAALATTTYGRAFLALADQAALMALLSASSETVQGKVELATTAEATTGTDTARAVTPAGLKTAMDARRTGLRYQFSGNIVAADPTNGQLAHDEDLAGLWISHVDLDGNDWEAFLDALDAGNRTGVFYVMDAAGHRAIGAYSGVTEPSVGLFKITAEHPTDLDSLFTIGQPVWLLL